MDIHKRGTRVMVELEGDELEELGLSFETLREKGLPAGIFFAALRAQLLQSGMGSVRGDIRVSRRGGKVLLTMNAYTLPECFSSPEKVIERCLDADCEAELYGLGDDYLLLFPDCDPVEAAKTREHGRLISDAVVGRIADLIPDREDGGCNSIASEL